MAWTAPRTWLVGEVATAAQLNTHLRDNLRFLKGLDGRTDFESAIAFINDISPAQIIANQNDYNPASLAGAVIVRLTTDASRNITGLQGGADGRIVSIVNVGSFDIVLTDEDALSLAANRFALTGNLTLRADQGVILVYDSTSSRWRVAGSGGPIDASDIRSGTIATARLGSGTAGTTTFLRGDQSWAVPGGSRATQAALEAETDEDTYASPNRVKFSPGVAKAWAIWTPPDTVIDASYNVSSITDNAAGDFTVNWTTAFSSVNYPVVYGGRRTGGDHGEPISEDTSGTQTHSTTAVRLWSTNIADSAQVDQEIASAAAFGDQ